MKKNKICNQIKNLTFPLGLATLLVVVGIIFIIKNAFHLRGVGFSEDIIDQNYIKILFSLAGIIFLYDTIIRSQNNNKQQQENFDRQQFENRFFELLKIHRENVRSFPKYKNPDSRLEEYLESQAYFVKLKEHFKEIFILTHKNNYNLKIEDVINVSFLFLYYGVSKSSLSTLQDKFEKMNLKELNLSKIIEILHNKKAKYNTNLVKYGGHQLRLSHYFRHLNQTIKFVDKNDLLSDIEKYEYIKLLRAQLSQPELEILLYNSLSSHGKSWNEEPFKFIEKYKLFKNLPKVLFELGELNVEPKEFYPEITFDWEKK
ncbi:putative phage abortive infection protein [Aureivirga marina]|uniref:putative phage abortive infection protein n=1 Tax=Aureivirga marina TaxID=1182451 RepID=UPI0018CAFBDF|nr:putative phage abortive infection protein [Aureivirga marina]